MQSFFGFVFIVFRKHDGTDNESSKISMTTSYCDLWKAKTFWRRYQMENVKALTSTSL